MSATDSLPEDIEGLKSLLREKDAELAQACATASNATAEAELCDVSLVAETEISDRRYELRARECVKCGKPHYEIWRWCRASFARWLMRPEFQPDEFLEFVSNIDEDLLTPPHILLYDFQQELDWVNSPYGIEADWSYSFRLIEYGGQTWILARSATV